ncbi:MAG: hypothetical protein C4543_10805 [Ignavibacteriales bacterium]|jgi:hypothetical protein|nr:MAG: hypothetical protein C4543_10805 [Ignavibacteriales bacterium]
MKNTILLWLIAVVITISSAVYQRITGPTYPLSGKVTINEKTINYKLLRTFGGTEDAPVEIEIDDASVSGTLYWKRFKTDDEFIPVPMKRVGEKLIADLPNQPPAGKLEYYIEMNDEKIPAKQNVVIRFKGDVPPWLLIPHVIGMFAAMLLATRTGLEFFRKGKDNLLKLTYWTLSLLLLGGFVLGPAVQLYAFGAWWTGFPFGTDLTDNKTLIALTAWLIAFFMYKKSNRPKTWALGAAIVMLIVYLIPHSLLGSELDYNKLDEQQIEMQSSTME